MAAMIHKLGRKYPTKTMMRVVKTRFLAIYKIFKVLAQLLIYVSRNHIRDTP
jgi:hypothetical protein